MKIHDWSRTSARRRGGALVLSLLAVVSVVVLAASFSQFASAVAGRQAQAINRKRAFYMAEAGLAEAFAGLSCGKTGNVGSKAEPALLGDGLFWTEAKELEAVVIELKSTGMIGTGSAVLSVVAKRGEMNVAELGVFANGQISVGAGSVIDGYDSTKGAYGPQTDKSGASLGSNGAITVVGAQASPTKVVGDVTPGPDKTATIGSYVTVTGSNKPALVATELPEVEMPVVELGEAKVQSSPYPLVIPAGNVGYQGLTVHGGSEVMIQGPATVVIGSLVLDAQAKLSFDTQSGPVHLYVTQDLQFASQSLLSTSSTNPDQVLIQVPGATTNPVTLRPASSFYGVIYAPHASVVVGSSLQVFGALVANSLSFDGAAKLHFDRHLAALSAEARLPGMITWRIIDLGNSSGDLSTDPFDFLGVVKNVLPLPAKAHADQTLNIDYYDFSSVYHRYIGLESSFDWNVVKTPIYVTRDGVEVLVPTTGGAAQKAGLFKSPGVVPVMDGPMI